MVLTGICIYIYCIYLYVYIYTVPRLKLQSTFGGSQLPLFVDQVQLRNGLEHPAPPPHRPGSVNGASPEIPDPTWTQTCINLEAPGSPTDGSGRLPGASLAVPVAPKSSPADQF